MGNKTIKGLIARKKYQKKEISNFQKNH